MPSENAKLPHNFSQMEMMRMMFGEEFLLASNNDFEESNEELDIFKDIFFKNGVETVTQNGFEIISNFEESNLEENNISKSQNEILEPHPLEFETLGLRVDDNLINQDIISQNGNFDQHIISENNNFNHHIISQNGNFDQHIISQNGNYSRHIISQNGNFDQHIISQNGNFEIQNGANHNMYIGPSEVDLYATIGGNLGTSSDNFIESDPLEFDQDIALHSESTDEEETEPIYGNMGMENERNIISSPLEYDLPMDPEIHDQTYGETNTPAYSEETNQDSENQEPKSQIQDSATQSPKSPIQDSTNQEPKSLTFQDSTNREPKSLSKDLSDQLRAHANRVLTESGWQIDPRKRSDRTKLAAYYKYPPKDLIFTTFSKAWQTCAEIMEISSDVVKEWCDASTFWVDLAETISRLWVGQSLSDKWRVLDPFVALVCVDKKVHVLRNKGVVRVVNGVCVVVSEGRKKRDVVNYNNNGNGDDNNGDYGNESRSNKGRRVKRKKCGCGEMDCGDNYNYNDVNVGLVKCKYDRGINNNDNYDKIEFGLFNDSVDMDHLDYPRSLMETKLVNNSVKKARKRSKRISEIDAPGSNGDNLDIKPPKKPRSKIVSKTEPAKLVVSNPEPEFPESKITENGFPENHFLENDSQENSLNESGLTKSIPDSLISITSSNLVENPSQNEINNNNNTNNNNSNNNDDDVNDAPKPKQRGRKPKNPAGTKNPKIPKNGHKRPRGFHIYDDDLLITAIMKNKDFNSSGKFASTSNPTTQKPKKKYKMRTLRKTPKRKFQLALRNKSGLKGKKKKNSFDSRRLILARKTVLSWLIATGGIALNEIIQYRNMKTNQVLKQGWVTLEGILCSCCNKIMSLTEFKTHAGPTCQRSGNNNIFLQCGKSFTLCQLEAWSAEYRLRKGVERVNGSGSDKDDENDDTCALCGDGGELLCCDKCPNTYHPACLPSQDEVPEGSWYCWHCICQSCGNAVGGKTDISTSSDHKCLQCEDSYHDTCIGGITSDPDSWFCGISCQEIHQWLRSHVGVANFFDDGMSWTILRSNHEEQKVHSTQKIALMAECNTKLAVALTLMEECFVPMVDPRTHIDMIPHVVYNRGSNFARLDYKGFYTVVLEKGDDIVSVASLRIHGNRIAEMPLVATNTEYRRQGMCRRLLDTIERMLRSFRVKMLVLSAIPDLVDTWVTGFGFKPIQENEKKLLNNITLMLFPGSSILTKNLIETETQISGDKKDMDEREDEMNNEETNYHNLEDLNENSNSKLGQSENGIMKLDIRTINPDEIKHL